MVPWLIPAIISGVSALGGALSNRGSQQQTSGAQHSETNNINRPFFTPEQGGVFYPTADAFLANLNRDPDLSGYRAGQEQGINELSDVKKKALQIEMATRGIAPNSTAALAYGRNIDNQRFSDITKLNQSIPLLREDITKNRIGQGIDLFRSLPSGMQSQGGTDTIQQGTVDNPGNIAGGLIGNLAPILAYLYGQGGAGIASPSRS